MDDAGPTIVALQAALENMRSALTSSDLSHLLAAQEQCAAISQGVAHSLEHLSDESRRTVAASLERVRATLRLCQSINAHLLSIVEQCRLQSEGPLDYNRSGHLAGLPVTIEREASVSCRV